MIDGDSRPRSRPAVRRGELAGSGNAGVPRAPDRCRHPSGRRRSGPPPGPFPEGWPGLPSTTLLVESEPARVDPAELDDCIALIGGSRSAVVDALVHGDRREALRHAQLVRECFGRDRIAHAGEQSPASR